MARPKCYPSSSIGWDVDISHNFLDRPETYSITWDDGFHFEDKSSFRAYHQCEPPDILDVRDKLIANHKFYDLIMAFDERVLRECPNAKFLTESACSWLPRKWGETDNLSRNRYAEGLYHKNPVVMKYDGCDVSKKRFSVSFLTSSKNMSAGHALRQDIFNRLPAQVGMIPTWKHKSPPIIDDKRTILEPYMFSICPENSRHSGYYTEKIVDCFIAKTIPVYWGCTDIGKHFNIDGIIQFENYDELIAQLHRLTPEFYRDREPAIEENFRRALQGVHQWNLIEDYISEGIANKFGGAK